jgi:hypothetical protein
MKAADAANLALGLADKCPTADGADVLDAAHRLAHAVDTVRDARQPDATANTRARAELSVQGAALAMTTLGFSAESTVRLIAGLAKE